MGTFEELVMKPDIYIELWTDKLKGQASENIILNKSLGSTSLINKITATEQEIQSVMENLAQK